MECARSMRFHVGFHLQFWVDVVYIVVYLINRGPLSSLDGGIPKEAWTGRKVIYFFLRLLVVKHLSILINKIEQSLRKNSRSVPLLDTMLMILIIAYGIMKIKKSLGV
jgi:hypothetical protein